MSSETSFWYSPSVFDEELKKEDYLDRAQLERNIEDIQKQCRETTSIKLKTAIRRNVIFVGRSRVGKTTVINVLKDPTHMAKSMSIFADTMFPSLYSFTVQINTKDEEVTKNFPKLRSNLKSILLEDFKREMIETQDALDRLNGLQGKKIQKKLTRKEKKEKEKKEKEEENKIKQKAKQENKSEKEIKKLLKALKKKRREKEKQEKLERLKEEEKGLTKEELNKLFAKREKEEKEREKRKQKYEKFKKEVENLESVNFNINIIDTPGLCERREIGTKIRDNSSLKKTILTCLDNEIASIHAIFFVASVEDGVNVEDIEALEDFLKLFSGAEENLAIILTHAENKSAQVKLDVYNQLLKQKHFSKYISKKRPLFFSGANTFENFTSSLKGTIDSTISDVSHSRDMLLYYIFLRKDPVPVREFKIISDQAKVVLKDMQKLDGLLSAFFDKKKDDGFLSAEKLEIKNLADAVFAQSKFVDKGNFDFFAKLQTKYNRFKQQTKDFIVLNKNKK